MGQSLRVLHNSSWSTIEAPYVMTDGVWRTVHKVWVMHSGAWKESHITPYTKYASGSGGQSTTTTSGTWTVPPNTKYIRVTILGNGGGGGTANRTNSYHPKNGQESGAPGVVGSTATNYSSTVTSADGGDGGAGGKAEVVLEVEAGTIFTYTNLGSPGGGGNQDDSLPNSTQTQAGSGTGNLYLRRNNYDSDYNVTPPTASTHAFTNSAPDDGHTDTGTYQRAASGGAGSTIVFSGASAVGGNYNIEVYGGSGGGGGYLQTSSRTAWPEVDWVFRYWTYLYTITATAGSNGGAGGQTSSGGNRVVVNMTSGGGGAGGAGGDATDTFAPGGSTGTGGSITIETYQGL